MKGNRHTLNITDWVQDISDGKTEDYGLVFTCPSKGMSACLYGPQFNYMTDESGNGLIPLYMTIVVNYREMEAYDASVELGAEYNSETGKIETKVTDQNELPEGTAISGYKIYERKNDSSNFTVVCKGVDISETEEILPKDADNIDLRVCILYSTGTVRLSNIVSLNKIEEADKAEQEDDISVIAYEQTTFDTDGDGLEDGYEIWDFKTKWNEKDEGGNYITDSDGDGFPDGYEVFTLGTDPAVANPEKDEQGHPWDSDGDGLSDKDEYIKGTDPWLKNSDFDGTNDNADTTPRRTNGYTRRAVATASEVHVGLYDIEYSEIEDGVTYTYIKNVYRGDIKKIMYDYEDITLDKTIKFFYDSKGNNTAIIEQYDSEYSNNEGNAQTICITYTYDESNNVTFICDQSTKYTMSYDNDNNMTSLKVGNIPLINKSSKKTTTYNENNLEDEVTSEIVYGNNQKIKTVTSTYDAMQGVDDNVEKIDEIYYSKFRIAGNGEKEWYYESQPDYIIQYDIEGNVVSTTDFTKDTENPIVYEYNYSDNGIIVERNDGFTRSVTTDEEVDDAGVTTKTTITSYNFQNVLENEVVYESILKEKDDSNIATIELYNDDTFSYSYDSERKVTNSKLYSNLYKKDIVKYTESEKSNTNTSYNIDIYAEDKAFDYTYDLAGNITEIKINGDIIYQYTYDPHGRLITEKDRIAKKYYKYNYDESANIHGKEVWEIDDNGNIKTSTKETILSEYDDGDNSQWSDKLTSYDGTTITYDDIGNPLSYINGIEFTWNRGRQLSEIKLDKDNFVHNEYNEQGLRTKKETSTTSTEYTWIDNNLVRERVTYKATNKTYDVWYLYDTTNTVIGYQYSYINDQNEISNVRIYYEKDLQGNVIGLLDSRGAEIATYAYDAWGNITQQICYEGYETSFNLNHITYRGYYRDNETKFYYLQSRYYDPEVGRFINADEVEYIGVSQHVYGNNIFAYCEGNPVNYTDPSGHVITPANVIGAVIGVIGGAVIGKAIVSYFKLTGWKKKIVLASTSALIGVAGWFAGPAIYSAIRPLVVKAIQTCSLTISASKEWVLKALGIGRCYIDQIFRRISVNTVKYTKTVLDRLQNPARAVPVQTLIQCIKYGQARPDPQGTKAIMYYITMYKNGKAYRLEVLIDWATKTIRHFLYK